MNILSMFDGMSCGRIALDRAGISVNKYYASEIDKYAIKVAQANYHDTVQLGDCTSPAFMNWVNAMADKGGIDMLIGGSPCQGFSSAGRHGHFDDPRSKLFWQYVKILGKLKPKYFLLENVKMKQESMDVISDALGVEPILINSDKVSAHNRQRYYWTNIPFTGRYYEPIDKGIKLCDIIEDGYVDRDKSYCIDANYWKGGNLTQYFQKRRRQLVFTDETMTEFRKLTPLECERLQTVPEGYTAHVSNTQRYKMLGNGWTVDVIAHIFKGVDNG